jgi:hypothetical protein
MHTPNTKRMRILTIRVFNSAIAWTQLSRGSRAKKAGDLGLASVALSIYHCLVMPPSLLSLDPLRAVNPNLQ